MPEPDLCLLFLRPLNRLGTRYIVSGSVAAILYGEPRLTHDVDLDQIDQVALGEWITRQGVTDQWNQMGQI